VGQALGVDVREFNAVYADNERFVRNVLRRMVSPSAIDDAVQDVFVVVHRRLPEFDGSDRLRGWLFMIAQRVACRYRRLFAVARLQQPWADTVPGDALTPAELAEHVETLWFVRKAMGRLDEAQRTILVLADVEGKSAPEISALTGVGLSTVYTRLRRARIELRTLTRKHVPQAPSFAATT
jgi:RNA polymerase sigma-70 factor (ECF subfamily)